MICFNWLFFGIWKSPKFQVLGPFFEIHWCSFIPIFLRNTRVVNHTSMAFLMCLANDNTNGARYMTVISPKVSNMGPPLKLELKTSIPFSLRFISMIDHISHFSKISTSDCDPYCSRLFFLKSFEWTMLDPLFLIPLTIFFLYINHDS